MTDTKLPDGSAFFTASLPLPKDHWLTAPRCQDWDDERDTTADTPRPFLNHAEHGVLVRAAMQYAIRAATMQGQEMDFDPDALVQNAMFAMCGSFVGVAARTTIKTWQEQYNPTVFKNKGRALRWKLMQAEIDELRAALKAQPKGLFVDMIAEHPGLAEEMAQSECPACGFPKCQPPDAWESVPKDFHGNTITTQPVQSPPPNFLANGMRFKLSLDDEGKVSCFWNRKELDGRWVALVAAEDNCHLEGAKP